MNSIWLLEEYNKHSSSPETMDKLCSLLHQLSTHIISRYDYHIKKLWLSYYISGNNPGAYLVRWIKAHLSRSKISHLLDVHGRWLTKPQDISDSFANYYSSLYNLTDHPSSPAPSASDIKTFLDSLFLPYLSPKQLESVSSPFTTYEIQSVIQRLPL